MQNLYLTLANIAKMAGISRQRMYVLMSELRGPPIAAQTMTKILFDPYVVAQWIIIRNKTKQVKEPTDATKQAMRSGLESMVTSQTQTPMTMKKYKARLSAKAKK
jgi:hypothetical protein